jgi:transposase
MKIAPDGIFYIDSFRSYNALDVSKFKHFKINHEADFSNGHNHINGIESTDQVRGLKTFEAKQKGT